MATPKNPNDTQKILWWVAIILSLLAFGYIATTILKPGLPSGHDIAAHALRLKVFNIALRQGQFPVRWVDGREVDRVAGLPLFNFYQVGFYYAASLVSVLLGSLTTSIKVTVLLLWWVGSGLIFLWLKRWGVLPAVFGALIYAFTPYIILDVFVRAAYPELTSITFSVGVFWALDRLLLQRKTYFAIPLSIFLALVILSHMPTFLIMSPLFIGYILTLILTNQVDFTSLAKTTLSLILGIGLASFYLLPALLELDLVNKQYLTSGSYSFKEHFVLPEQLFTTAWGYGRSVAGPGDAMSFQIGLLQLIVLIAGTGLLAYGISRKKHKEILPYIAFWSIAVLYGLFFMHDISIAFWENINQLRYIQYPWRFLMVIPIATGIIAGLILTTFKPSYKSIVMISSVFLIFVLYRSFMKPLIFLPDTYFNIDTKEEWKNSQGTRAHFAFELGYLPAGIVKELPKGKIPRAEVVKGSAQLQIIEEKYHKLALKVDASQPSVLSVNTHYFPGWKIYIDNQEADINFNNTYKFMLVSIPQGLHTIEARFTDTPIRKAANLISFVSLLILVIWQVRENNLFAKLR